MGKEIYLDVLVSEVIEIGVELPAHKWIEVELIHHLTYQFLEHRFHLGLHWKVAQAIVIEIKQA